MKNLVFIAFSMALVACGGDAPAPVSNDTLTVELPTILPPQSSVRLSDCPPASAQPDAQLHHLQYQQGNWSAQVNGFVLGVPDSDEARHPSAISPKGNYLHWNFNNEQHLLTNDANRAERSLPDGKHQVFGFLVRSYHRIIQTPNAFLANEIELKNGKIVQSKAIETPVLIYGTPHGLYRNEEGEHIVLDFGLLNTQLSPSGNRVRVVINQQDTFVLNTAKAQYIEGLGVGEHQLQLELLDANQQVIYGPIRHRFIVNEEKEKS